MDRSWMKIKDRFHSKEYEDGMKIFMAAARKHKDKLNRVLCPCVSCKNCCTKK